MPRSPRATITASAVATMPARWSSATAVSIFATRCGLRAALRQAGAHRFDVFRTAHEREPDEVGLDAHRHLERDRVGVGERFDVTFGARHVHALARPQHAGAHDAALDVVAVDASRRTTRSRRRRGTPRRRPAPNARDRGWWSTRGARRPRSASAVSTKRLSIRSSTSSSATGPVRSFGPGQVDQHADRAVERRGRGARGRRLLGVHLGRAVRGVEPHDVDTRVEQRLERVGLRRRRSDRRHDLGSPH